MGRIWTPDLFDEDLDPLDPEYRQDPDDWRDRHIDD